MTQFDVTRIQAQVEGVYERAHKRAAGLALMARAISMSQSSLTRPAFIDCLNWVCASLRQESLDEVVHYLDGLRGCGHILEKAMRDSFFIILDHIVKQLAIPTNTEQEV
jgi:hypothetical protein